VRSFFGSFEWRRLKLTKVLAFSELATTDRGSFVCQTKNEKGDQIICVYNC
jgi:hypothetical protein